MGRVTFALSVGAAGHVFVPEADAATFFKTRGRRSVQYYYYERQGEGGAGGGALLLLWR